MEIEIDKLVYGGDGLGRLPSDDGPGKAVFVPFVLEGESVDAVISEQKRGFARGRVRTLLQSSPHRVTPGCPYFQRCGGCHYQHAAYAHQLDAKATILRESLRRTAKLELPCELQIHASPEWNYRNRTRLQVRTKPAFAVGYYRAQSHDLLPVEKCPISSPLINRAIAEAGKLEPESGAEEGIEEIEFFVDAADSHLLLALHLRPEVARAAARRWVETVGGLMPEIVGVTAFRRQAQGNSDLQKVVASGAEHFSYQTRRLAYRVRIGSFFQVNRHLIDELVGIVTDRLAGESALDLYAGVGLFSSVLAGSFAQVTAVEPSQTSFADLLYNSASNVEAVQATAEQYLQGAVGDRRPELVVVDPPRSGLGDRVVAGLATMGAPRLVYVSCDPATLARDLGGLLKSGYRIEEAHLVDLFPQTFHLESVFHLSR